MMFALLLATQAPASPPSPPPARELVAVAPAAITTRVRLDAEGQPTGCSTEVSGMTGNPDGCLLFGRPALLERWLGRPLRGLVAVDVRLRAVPRAAVTPALQPSMARLLGSAAISVAPDGTVTDCTADKTGNLVDLCPLLPRGGAAFSPAPGASPRALDLRFEVIGTPR